MRQNVCGKTWTPRLSVRLLWLLHLTLGCPVPVPSISLCMNPEKCIYCTNTMKLLFTWLPIIYQPGYHTPTAFAVDASPCSLYAREKKKSLGDRFAGLFGKQLIFLPTGVLRSTITGRESRWMGSTSSQLSSVVSHWWLESSHSGSIFTTEIKKR